LFIGADACVRGIKTGEKKRKKESEASSFLKDELDLEKAVN